MLVVTGETFLFLLFERGELVKPEQGRLWSFEIILSLLLSNDEAPSDLAGTLQPVNVLFRH
jgi:hypothetical protein